MASSLLGTMKSPYLCIVGLHHLLILVVPTLRLLLSVDRRQSIADAYDTVKLAHQYSLVDGAIQGKVIGLDLSGDPKVYYQLVS